MGREPRIEFPGGMYHITSRGNDKQPIFFDDGDRLMLFELVAKAARRHGWRIYAYCLMTNHYHLVLQIAERGLSAGMKLLNGGYSRQTNRRYGRSDHLFRNRFSGRVIRDDAHLLESARYVVLNPVRAGLCDRPEDWPWSSYRACAGLEIGPSFLSTSELLRLFASRPLTAIRAYRDFVAEGHVPVSDTVPEV